MCGVTTSINAYDRQGNSLDRQLERNGLRIYGLAYWPDDPDGYNLYVVNNPQNGQRRINKYNTLNAEIMQAWEELGFESASAEGVYICSNFDFFSWVCMLILNTPIDNGGDILKVLHMGSRIGWMSLDEWEGELQADETRVLLLTLTANVPPGIYVGEIIFHNDAEGGDMTLNISMEVIGAAPPEPFELMEPANGDTINPWAWPDSLHIMNPVRFIWSPSHDPNIADSVITYLHRFTIGNESGVAEVQGNNYVADFDSIYREIMRRNRNFDWTRPIRWWVQALAGGDTTESDQRFTLYFTRQPPWSVDDEPVPVEFGFQNLHPNPFNGQMTIRFGIDRASLTSITAYDMFGREAASIYKGVANTGEHTCAWTADGLASGVYMLKLSSGGRTETAKVVLVR
jgi:hypothetical protein